MMNVCRSPAKPRDPLETEPSSWKRVLNKEQEPMNESRRCNRERPVAAMAAIFFSLIISSRKVPNKRYESVVGSVLEASCGR